MAGYKGPARRFHDARREPLPCTTPNQPSCQRCRAAKTQGSGVEGRLHSYRSLRSSTTSLALARPLTVAGYKVPPRRFHDARRVPLPCTTPILGIARTLGSPRS